MYGRLEKARLKRPLKINISLVDDARIQEHIRWNYVTRICH